MRLFPARAAALALAGLGTLAAGQTARAQVAGRELSLDAAIAIARASNPGLQADENDVAVSDAAVRAARRDAIIPTLNTTSTVSYSASGQRRSGSVLLAEQPSVYSSSYGVTLGYTLTASRFVQPTIARADRDATLARLATSEAQLRHDVAIRYLAVVQAQQGVAQAEIEVARANDYFKLARVREALGAASVLDLKRAEVQVAQTEVKLTKARADVRSERASLARTLGTDLPGDVALTSAFTLAEPALDADALTAMALGHSASLQAKRDARVAAGARARVARLAYLPTISLSLSMTGWAQRTGSMDAAVAQRLGSSTDTALASKIRAQVAEDFRGFPFNYTRQPLGASVTVSYPLLPGWNRESQVAQSRAATVDADFAIRGEIWRIRTEVENGVRAVESAWRMAKLQGALREKSAEELRLVLDRARFGAVGGLPVADAQNQLGQAELAEVDAIHDFHRALLDLELIVGLPLAPRADTRP